MTKEEAEKLKTFQHHCTCGGFAWSMNERKESQPHMTWCPQFSEYEEWYRAMRDKDGARSKE